MLLNQKKKKLLLLKSFYDFSLELISLHNIKIIKTTKFKTENKNFFKKLKNTYKRCPTITNKSNDTSLFFSKYRPMFWSDLYPVATNSSLSFSIDFNISIQKHFDVLNNLDSLVLNDNFYFSDIFDKFEHSNDSINIQTNSFLNSIQNKKNSKVIVLNNIKKTVTYILNNKLLSNFNTHDSNLIHFLNTHRMNKTLISWKLLNNFSTKNVSLLNNHKNKDTRVGQIDKFTLNIDSYDADEYTIRLYDNYGSSDFYKNSNSVLNKFMSDYEFLKNIEDPSHYNSSYVLEDFSNSFDLIYSHFFFISGFDYIYSGIGGTKQCSIHIHKPNSIYKTDIFNINQNIISSYKLTTFNIFNLMSRNNYVFNTCDSLLGKNLIDQVTTTLKLKNVVSSIYSNPVNNSTRFNYLGFFKTSITSNLSTLKHNNSIYIDTTDDTFYNIVSKSGSSFIIQHVGLLLHFKLFWFKPKFDVFKFRFKKKIFSFYKTNEIKKTLMENRKSLSIFRYIDSKNWSFNKRLDYEYTNYDTTLDFYHKKQLELKSISTLKFRNYGYINSLTGYNRSTSDISYTDALKKSTLDAKNSHSDLRIPRLRFNPGYQRLWREYRLALGNAIRFKYIYQKQLTRYLVKFYSFLKSYNILALEYKVWKIIIYSRLLPDLHSIRDFMSNSLVFLNGQVLKNENYIIVVNDIVQLQVSIWYYIYYKWLMSWNNLRIRKFKKLVYRKKIASSYTIIKSLKQKSKYTPAYIYNMRFDMSDTKSYLEIDYFTLSFILIYDNFILDFNSPDDFPEMRHYVYRMYNWKYIN